MKLSITLSVFVAVISAARSAPQKSNCECVPYYMCLNGTINTEGIGLIDKKATGSDNPVTWMTMPREIGESCENYLDSCCELPDVPKPEDKVTPAPEVTKPENKVTPKPSDRKSCGKRNPDGLGVKITGQTHNEAQFGEFPWMVAILMEEITDGKAEALNVFQCGGALIYERAVLTAASCVNGKDSSRLRIRAGEWDTQTKDEQYAHQTHGVESVIVHENFNSGSLVNDVAILILKTRVDIAENVDVVCLPEPNENFDGSRCFATGWGKDIFGKDGKYQKILKGIELPVVPHDSCQTSLRSTRLGKYFNLDPTFICAGGEPGKDTCKGDGGGPLVCPSKNDPTRYVQVGIVSWGIGCGETQVPGVYANVAALRKWIDEKVL